MKKLIFLIPLMLIMLSGCKWFKKGGLFSKGSDTLLVYSQKMDSTLKAEAIKYEDRIEQVISESNAKIESLKAEYEKKIKRYEDKYHIIVGAFLTPEYADAYSELYAGQGYDKLQKSKIYYFHFYYTFSNWMWAQTNHQ